MYSTYEYVQPDPIAASPLSFWTPLMPLLLLKGPANLEQKGTSIDSRGPRSNFYSNYCAILFLWVCHLRVQ